MKTSLSSVKTAFQGTLPRLILGGLVIAGTAVGGTYAFRTYQLGRAEALMSRGFHQLAAEELDEMRFSFTGSNRGCAALINAYAGARQFARLEWAAESCVDRGQQTTETIVGLATAWEQTQRVEAATQLLQTAMENYKEVADFPHKLGMILNGQKNVDGAVKMFMEAHRRAPKAAKLALDYLVFFGQNGRWSEAAIVAESLKDAQTEDPEVKLLIARAFQQSGRTEAARAQAEVARTLMDKAPNKREALMKNFADLLQAGGDATPAAAPASAPRGGRNLASDGPATEPMRMPPPGGTNRAKNR